MVTARAVAPVPELLELWATSRSYLPGKGPVPGLREAAFTAFREIGLPTTRAEAWKYTNIVPWANRPLRLPPREVPGTDKIAAWFAGGVKSRRLIFVNGHLLAELAHVGGLPAGVEVRGLGRLLQQDPERVAAALAALDEPRGLTALNTALATSGAWVELADGAALDEPLQLLFLTTATADPVLCNLRNVVRLGRGARLHLIETHAVLGDATPLSNVVSQLHLGEGAELRHDRVEIGAAPAALVERSLGEIGAGAKLHRTVATLGYGLSRHEQGVRLIGAGAEALLNGVFTPTGKEHVDTQIRVEHLAPSCHSNQFYKGVVDGRSHAVFAGKIFVDRVAQKTDAYQSNNNLLLSDEAELDSKPELEIYADDVKCSHGATVGDLDMTALFYLRSRGLPLSVARAMLVFGWAEEVLERMTDAETSLQARRAFLARLPGGPALGEP